MHADRFEIGTYVQGIYRRRQLWHVYPLVKATVLCCSFTAFTFRMKPQPASGLRDLTCNRLKNRLTDEHKLQDQRARSLLDVTPSMLHCFREVEHQSPAAFGEVNACFGTEV